MKARSVTLPAAQRAALEECSSFQMVSVSTCGGQSQGPHRPRLPTGARARGWCPPHGQNPRGRELGRQCCLPSAPPPKGKASCIPQSQHDVSFPASVHITSPYLPALCQQHRACLPGQSREHGVTWAGLGVWAGRGFKPQLALLRPCGMVGARGAVCTTVFHSGPLAQAGRPPKPSPWASRLGRGRGA